MPKKTKGSAKERLQNLVEATVSLPKADFNELKNELVKQIDDHVFERALAGQIKLKDELPKNAIGGIKDDAAKLQWSLLPWDALEGVVKILMIGAKKYARDNFRKVDRERYVDATLRHLTDFMRGKIFDSETKCPLLWHLGCDVLFLISLYGDEGYEYPAKNSETNDKNELNQAQR